MISLCWWGKNWKQGFAYSQCFHSRGQRLCKFMRTKESVCITKEFNSQRTCLGHQHGRGFIVLGHQYGHLDVMWKNVLNLYTFLACPGGIQLPCSRRGKCIDGLEGDGSCVCDTGYNGTACESCVQNSDSCPGILKKCLLFLSLK